MSLIIKGMCLPKHAAFNGEKDTVYKCVVLTHPDNTVGICTIYSPGIELADDSERINKSFEDMLEEVNAK